MIPETTTFTGLRVPTKHLLSSTQGRCVTGPFSPAWTRVIFEATPTYTQSSFTTIDIINRWLMTNMNGRWGIIESNQVFPKKTKVVIYFEEETDAVMFKLLGGDTACFNPQVNE